METLGSMEKREKIEYILEQMRICLACEEYLRVLLISRKIAPKVLLEDEFWELKLRFHRLIIQVCSVPRSVMLSAHV